MEPTWSLISGLYARPRSKRIYIHRPIDDTLVEVRPDQSVLVKDAFGRNGDSRRGYGFAFAPSPDRAPRLPNFRQVEQSMPDPQIPIVESWIRQDDFEHRFTLLTTSDKHGGGCIHLFVEVKNVHPSRRTTGEWYFLQVRKPHSEFYVHGNEDYIPFVSEETPWLVGIGGTHNPYDEFSGVLFDEDGGIAARYRIDKRAEAAMTDRSCRFRGALRLAIDLAPGECATIQIEIPYTAYKTAAPSMLDRAGAVEACKRLWERALSGGMRVQLPDAQVQRIFDTTTANHFQLMAQSEDPSVILPGQGGFNDYSVVYSWEVSYYIKALDRLGYHTVVEKILNYFLTTQDGSIGPEGDILSPEGSFRPHIHWMSETGAVLMMLADHYWMTRDDAWFAQVAERCIRACRWIVRERNATKLFAADGAKVKHYGLLPAGRPHDWPHRGYFYMSDAYTWRGLYEIARILGEIRHPDACEFVREAEDYKACIQEALRHGTYMLEDQGLRWVSNEVYTKPGEPVGIYPLDGPAALISAGLIDENDPLVAELEQYLRNEGTLGELFSCKMVMEDRQLSLLQEGFAHGKIDLFYVNSSDSLWHKIWMLQGEREKALRYFWSTMAYSTTLDTGHSHERFSPQLPWLSPWQPNGSGNGRLFAMIADSLFLFHHGTLRLLPCIPADWLGVGKEIRVERAKTPIGEINFSVRTMASRNIAIRYCNDSGVPVLITIPPACGNIGAVAVQGNDEVAWHVLEASNQVRLIGCTSTVDIEITLSQ